MALRPCVCELESFLASLVIPRARYSRTCSVRLEITGRIERMNQEPQDAAASSQEVLGYENRGKGAKRRENGDDGRENGCSGTHTRKWEKLVATRGTLKGNKEEATAGGERERNGMTLTANRLRDIRIVQNLSRPVPAAFVRRIVISHCEFSAFYHFFSIFMKNLLPKVRVFDSSAKSLRIHSCQNHVGFSSSLFFSMFALNACTFY